MRTEIDNALSRDFRKKSFFFKMLPSALANVPFHEDTPSITRYFAADFPMHIAVHEISTVLSPPEEYTIPHLHDDCDEINIIISEDKLVYKVQIGSDKYIVHNNTSIWIPRGMLHSANVIEGSGYFVALRLNQS